MDFLDNLDKYFKNLRDNKKSMIFIIFLLSILTVNITSITKGIFDLFNNQIFKLIVFCFISYIANDNPSLAIMLTILVFTILQIVTYNNLISNEEFKHSNNMNFDFEDYLSKPLLKQDKLSPITSNLNLKLENPDEIYKNMIKKGRVLLDDSISINKDLINRQDVREKQIVNVTTRDGLNLIESGLNRLQVSNQGEYNINNTSNNKFIKYNNLIKNYVNDPQIMSAFNELKYSFNKLQSSTLKDEDINNFDEQLLNIYENELLLLELIYKNKKDNISIENQNKVNIILSNIKTIKLDTKIVDKYPLLLENIKSLVEYLS
jgi:hypothetical protein